MHPAFFKEEKRGVIEQYRDESAFVSTHTLVRDDGTMVSHIDLINPDEAPALAPFHFLVDHPIGAILVISGFAGYLLWRKR